MTSPIWAHRIVGVTLVILTSYSLFLAMLTIPYFQDQAIYLHKVKLTWFQDINEPERWGFLKLQVSPFYLPTPDGVKLHAWHILPISLYEQHEAALRAEPAGLAQEITETLGFRFLRDDTDALLVLYFHGAAGTLGPGYRPPSYRAISAGSPNKIHIVAIDYRGFGPSDGWPSEAGLRTDATTLTKWALETAGIPPSRIVVFAQSIESAVALSLTSSLALKEPPTLFAGMILVAPFTDVETLTAIYRLAGTVPLLSPLARFPTLTRWLNNFIVDKWRSDKRIASLIRSYETEKATAQKYHITIVHAEDDYDIHWSHSEKLFWHAVNASTSQAITYDALENIKREQRVSLGAGGWSMEWQTNNGIIREEILKHGLHDRIMSYPVVSMAVLRAFRSAGVLVLVVEAKFSIRQNQENQM